MNPELSLAEDRLQAFLAETRNAFLLDSGYAIEVAKRAGRATLRREARVTGTEDNPEE